MKIVKTPIEVRYQETDQMGVVYHANYLVWFEIGRTKYIEALGLSYAEMERENIVSPVTDAQISFKQPIRYGAYTEIHTWITEYDGIRTKYAYKVINDRGETAVTGITEHVIVKKDSFRPVSLKKAFPAWHTAYLNEIEASS